MTQKKIIIIGATSGIGKELALLYAESGCLVGITGRRENLLQELKQIHPGQIFTSCFDVMQNENQDKVEQLIIEMGGLDLLVYNSGYGATSTELQWELENTITKTNVNGFVEIVSFAFNYFVRQGYGQIALTSSVAALRGNSWAPAYSASKAFMSNYAEGLNIKAKKLGKNIVVTDLRPGFVDTKPDKGTGRFWVAPPKKAAVQIIAAIEKKKRIAYITKRWWLVAQILRVLPYSLFRRLA
jgi:short-subunit dehydrogenase